MRKETLIRHQSVSNDLKRDWKRDWRWTLGPVPDLSRTITFARRSFRELLAGILSDPSVRAAGFAFALSRGIVFFIFILATHVTLHNPPDQFGRSLHEVSIRLRRTSIADNMRMLALRSDGGWYISVAQNGYEQKPFDNQRAHNWAFFPLYPLAVGAAATLTGEFPLTAMALSNIFLLLALFVLHKTVLAFGHDRATADRAVFYTSVFPTSYFFSLPWTSSLFLLTTTASFWAAKRERWYLAGALAGLASATRYNGIFVFPALLILYWQSGRPFKLQTSALGLLLAPAGLLAFMAYLYTVTGNAFAFADVQSAWKVRWGFFLQPLFAFLISPFALSEGWNFRLLNFAAAVTALICGYVMIKRHESARAFYTFISVIIPLSTVTLEAHARYAIALFPVFIILAVVGRSSAVDQVIRGILTVLLTLMTTFFCFFFGLALI
jgi:hypothetical protein